MVVWVWSGGHSLRGLEEYYSSSQLTLQVSLCRSAQCIAHIQQAQSEEMVKVHPKYTKLEAALLRAAMHFTGGDI